MLGSVYLIGLFLLIQNLFTFLNHCLAVLSESSKAIDDPVEIGNSSLFLELLDLVPVVIRDAHCAGELVITLWKLELSKKSSLVDISLFLLFVLLINLVLHLLFKLTLHHSNLWGNYVSKHLIHHWNLG